MNSCKGANLPLLQSRQAGHPHSCAGGAGDKGLTRQAPSIARKKRSIRRQSIYNRPTGRVPRADFRLSRASLASLSCNYPQSLDGTSCNQEVRSGQEEAKGRRDGGLTQAAWGQERHGCPGRGRCCPCPCTPGGAAWPMHRGRVRGPQQLLHSGWPTPRLRL